MYFNIKCIGKLPGPTNEFEQTLVFETGEFERPKFDCTCIINKLSCFFIEQRNYLSGPLMNDQLHHISISKQSRLYGSLLKGVSVKLNGISQS